LIEAWGGQHVSSRPLLSCCTQRCLSGQGVVCQCRGPTSKGSLAQLWTAPELETAARRGSKAKQSNRRQRAAKPKPANTYTADEMLLKIELADRRPVRLNGPENLELEHCGQLMPLSCMVLGAAATTPHHTTPHHHHHTRHRIKRDAVCRVWCRVGRAIICPDVKRTLMASATTCREGGKNAVLASCLLLSREEGGGIKLRSTGRCCCTYLGTAVVTAENDNVVCRHVCCPFGVVVFLARELKKKFEGGREKLREWMTADHPHK